MIYVASPYSHPDPGVRYQRYLQVMQYTAQLLSDKQWCYSPIVHCHEMARVHCLPTDALFWQEYNEHVMRRCDDLHILCIPGWTDSLGVKMEQEFWESLGKTPILVGTSLATG